MPLFKNLNLNSSNFLFLPFLYSSGIVFIHSFAKYLLSIWYFKSEVVQLCLTLRDLMDCSPPGSSIHGIFQARVLEWGAIAFSEACLLIVPKDDKLQHKNKEHEI